MPNIEETDVLIIGGGFGGMNAALEFERYLKRRRDLQVTLISRSNFYLFTPLLPEVAASLVQSRHAVNPIRRMLHRVRFIEGTLDRIEPDRQVVGFLDENGSKPQMRYRPVCA